MSCCIGAEHSDWYKDYEIIYVDGEGKEYCIFHAPAEHKYVSKFDESIESDIPHLISGKIFNQLVYDRIDAVINAGKDETRDKWLENNWNPRCNFAGTIFHTNISFSKFGTKKVTYLPPISFEQSSFMGNVYFDNSQFSGNVNFEQSQFYGPADFRATRFPHKSYFTSSQFYAASQFNHTQFSGITHFRHTLFRGITDFRNAHFSGITHFISTRFYMNTEFKSAQFSGKTGFEASQFRSFTDFRDTQFNGITNFRDTQFRGITGFENCNFKATTYFENALFKELTGFKGSSFHKITFSSKTILNNLSEPLSLEQLATAVFMDEEKSKKKRKENKKNKNAKDLLPALRIKFEADDWTPLDMAITFASIQTTINRIQFLTITHEENHERILETLRGACYPKAYDDNLRVFWCKTESLEGAWGYLKESVSPQLFRTLVVGGFILGGVALATNSFESYTAGIKNIAETKQIEVNTNKALQKKTTNSTRNILKNNHPLPNNYQQLPEPHIRKNIIVPKLFESPSKEVMINKEEYLTIAIAPLYSIIHNHFERGDNVTIEVLNKERWMREFNIKDEA